jgi:hypothetical protein
MTSPQHPRTTPTPLGLPTLVIDAPPRACTLHRRATPKRGRALNTELTRTERHTPCAEPPLLRSP